MASSPQQIAAARANGAKSHGPKTAEGKLASSRNALQHGLTARTVVLDNESPDEYQSDLHAYLDHFHPQGKPEIDLVHQLAAAQWRLVRYARIECGLLEHKMDDEAAWLEEKYEDIPEHYRLAIAFESLSGANSALALLNRYQARLQREYQRLLKTLTDLQAARHAAEAKISRKSNLPNEPKPATAQPSEPPLPPPAQSITPIVSTERTSLPTPPETSSEPAPLQDSPGSPIKEYGLSLLM